MSFLKHRWFLIALAVVIISGFAFPDKLAGLADALPRTAIVASVLFTMALPLEINAMWRALRQPGPVVLSVAINMGVLPPLAWLVSLWLPIDLPDIALGLIIMASIPCTLASVAVWTRRAGGNDAVAILVTVITNGTCFLITPTWLRLLTNTQSEMPFAPLIVNLLALVLGTMTLAQLLRLHRPTARWATRQKTALGVYAQIGILSMVLIGAVRAGQELAKANNGVLTTGDMLVMIAATVGLHLFALCLGHVVARLCRMDREDRIAVGFAASQKTLMVGLYICLQYYPTFALATLPMVVYHVGQLLVDTLIADRFRKPTNML